MSGHIGMYLLSEADDRTVMLAGIVLFVAIIFTVIVGGYAWLQERKEAKNKKPE